MAEDLSPVEQLFDANTQPYRDAVNAAAAAARDFASANHDAVTSVVELQAAIDALHGKDVSIGVDAAGIAQTAAATEALNTAAHDASQGEGALATAAEDAAAATGKQGAATAAAVPAMAGLIGAGVALAPVIVTLGLGFGALALAAAGLKSQITAGSGAFAALKAEYISFQDALKPTLIEDFNAAIGAARPLLAGLEPVAKATGQAFAGFLGQLGTTFRSGEWQQFFGFMGTTAAGDMRLLGQTFINLLNAVPPLLEALQPLSQKILDVASATSEAVNQLSHWVSAFSRDFPASTQHTMNALQELDRWTVSLTNHIPGARAINDWLSGVQHGLRGTAAAAGPAAAGIAHTAFAANAAAAMTAALSGAVRTLIASYQAMAGPLLGAMNATATFTQQMGALSQAIHTDGDQVGVNTQKQAALTLALASAYQGALAASRAIDANTRSTQGAAAAAQAAAGPLVVLRDKIRDAGLEGHAAAALIHQLNAEIAGLHSKTITITTILQTLHQGGASAPTRPGYAGGTSSATPGLHQVAEQGAEIVLTRGLRNFAGGERVVPAAQTAALLSGGGGTTYVTNVHVYGSVITQQQLHQAIQKAVFDVQTRNPSGMLTPYGRR